MYFNLNLVDLKSCKKAKIASDEALCQSSGKAGLKKYCQLCMVRRREYCSLITPKEFLVGLYYHYSVEYVLRLSSMIDNFIRSTGDEKKPIEDNVKDFCNDCYQRRRRPRNNYLPRNPSEHQHNCMEFNRHLEALREFEPNRQRIIAFFEEMYQEDFKPILERCEIVIRECKDADEPEPTKPTNPKSKKSWCCW